MLEVYIYNVGGQVCDDPLSMGPAIAEHSSYLQHASLRWKKWKWTGTDMIFFIYTYILERVRLRSNSQDK